MEMGGRTYRVGALAKLAGVTIRTLHHYDEIGLLIPSSRSNAGYRLYAHDELLRLQQIMLYRDLDLSLEEIGDILDDPGFDPVAALTDHRRALAERIARTRRLLTTVDRTIQELKGGTMTLTDEELYEGFTAELAERYQREAETQYGPETVAQTTRRIRKLGKDGWARVKAEGAELEQALAEMMDRSPDAVEVQGTVARHAAWIGNFYEITPEIYRGLAQLYVTNDDFRAHYDRVAPGLADFLSTAMLIHADTMVNG